MQIEIDSIVEVYIENSGIGIPVWDIYELDVMVPASGNMIVSS